MPKRLFADVDSDIDQEVEFDINEEYAARLDHNKRREELHRLEEKLARNKAAGEADSDYEDESSSSDSEEEVDVFAELQDRKFLRALASAKERDYSEKAEAYSDEEEVEAKATKRKKRAKPVLLKDVVQGEEEETEKPPNSKPYARDLEDSRKDFLQAAEASEDEDEDLFTQQGGGSAASQPSSSGGGRGGQTTQELLDRYFGKDEELSKDDLFLKKFIARGDPGEDDEDDRPRGLWQADEDLEEDAAQLEKEERFEAGHNFRFQEAGSGSVKTYPRSVEGIVRQADTRRVQSRARKQQREAEEKAKRQADVQRLKNLKRQEIEDRLRQIREYSGMEGPDTGLQALLSSADFDGDEHDKAMQKVFGTAYYEAEDEEELGGEELEEAESEEEEGQEANAGFRATRKQLAASSGAARDAAAVQRLLEEYNKLDYEDIVAGMPTRFSYQKVEKVDFGLSTNDILSLTDKELNQVVGLKRIAPYKQERNVKKTHFQGLHRLNQLKNEKAAEKPKKSKMEELPSAELTEEEKKLRSREHRLATFAKPQLKRAGTKKEAAPQVKKEEAKKVEKQESQNAVEAAASDYTKAQWRNMRRTRLRKQKKKTSATS